MARNDVVVTSAKDALNRLKMEVASEIGVDLKDDYNGDLTAHDTGRVGGNMVKRLIEMAEKNLK